MSRRAALPVAAAALLLAAFCGRSALGVESDSSPTVFLRRDDPLRAAYDRFVATFGPERFLLATCRRAPGGDPAAFEERARSLARALAPFGAVFPEAGAALTRKLRLRDAANSRISIVLSSRDDPAREIPRIRSLLAEYPDLDPALAGGGALNLALRDASDAVGRRLFPFLLLVMAALVFLAYRSVRAVAAIFLTTALALLFGMAVIAWSGRPVNLVTVLLPVLLLSLTVALCIHLVNAFRAHRRAGLPTEEAIRAMRREEWRPCAVTTLTTCAGFGSFWFSRIEPLRVLGGAMALSFLAAWAFGFLLLPALLSLLRPEPREGLPIGAALLRIVPPLVRRRRLAPLALLGCAAATAASLPFLERETDALRYLPRSHDLRRETARLEAERVGVGAIEMLFRGGAPGEAAEAVRSAAPRIEALEAEGFPVRGALVAEDLPPPARPLFRREGVSRLSVRVDSMGVDAWHALRARLEALARGAGADGCEITGEFPMVMAVQESLLATLLQSLLGSTLTIFAILSVAHRSLRLGAILILPSLAPLAFVAVACAVASIPLSVATVMVLAVTLGIVTDDSVHLLDVFRSGRTLDEALRRVGTPVAETSMAIFLGFLVCAGADFVPTRQFGLLTAGAMAVALLADLVLFPALLKVPVDA